MHLIFLVFIIVIESKLSNTRISNPIFNCSSLYPKGFCQNYEMMNRTYLKDENKLKEKIEIYKENSKNGRIYLRKYFDTQYDDGIGPFTNTTICENELRVNYSDYDKSFCFLIVKYQRSYDNLSELRNRYNIFFESRKYYRDIIDNYFDRTEKEIRSLPFPFKYDKCIVILSPIISRFFEDEKQNTSEDFCKLSSKFKRNFTTIDDAWSAINYFTKRDNNYIMRLFDKNPENIYKFSSINECINDFYWVKENEIIKKFCENFEKKNIKASLSNINKELILFKKVFINNYLKNANNNRLLQYDVNAKLDISFNNRLTCVGEIKAVMLKYFKNQKHLFKKIILFCINMILFNRSYENVNSLIFRLESFTKNMEKLKKYKKKNFSLTVHKSRFFDYSFNELEKYNPGYKNPDPRLVKINNNTNLIDNNLKNKSIIFSKKTVNKRKAKEKNCIKRVNFTIHLKRLIDQTQKLRTTGADRQLTSKNRNGNRKSVFLEKKRRIKERKLNYKHLKKRNKYLRQFKEFVIKTKKMFKKNPRSILKKKINCKNPRFLNTFKITKTLMPKSLDYRKAGIINPRVYDQGNCGSCWVFSLAGMIESGRSLRSGKAPRALSRQYFLDCVDKGSCNGGNYIYGLQFALNNTFYLENEYRSYSGEKKKCKKPETINGLKYGLIKNFIIHKKLRATELKYMLLKGPVPVNIDASSFEFIFYKKGILRYKCKKPNHSVLLIGWNIDRVTGKQYWIIRNSWGKDWGNKGDAYIEMHDIWDACGMYREIVELPTNISLG